MNYTAIANVLGKLLIVTGSSMVFPLICSLYYREDDLYALAITGIITIGLGLSLWRILSQASGFKHKGRLFHRRFRMGSDFCTFRPAFYDPRIDSRFHRRLF